MSRPKVKPFSWLKWEISRKYSIVWVSGKFHVQALSSSSDLLLSCFPHSNDQFWEYTQKLSFGGISCPDLNLSPFPDSNEIFRENIRLLSFREISCSGLKLSSSGFLLSCFPHSNDQFRENTWLLSFGKISCSDLKLSPFPDSNDLFGQKTKKVLIEWNVKDNPARWWIGALLSKNTTETHWIFGFWMNFTWFCDSYLSFPRKSGRSKINKKSDNNNNTNRRRRVIHVVNFDFQVILTFHSPFLGENERTTTQMFQVRVDCQSQQQ
jgi:hypothetical protein